VFERKRNDNKERKEIQIKREKGGNKGRR